MRNNRNSYYASVFKTTLVKFANLDNLWTVSQWITRDDSQIIYKDS